MTGGPMRIHLKEGAVPFAVHTPRQIPFAFQHQVKEELESMVKQGIITPVGDEPSDWCHPLVVVAKNRGVRITVDLTKLNSQVSRPTHPLQQFAVSNHRQDTSPQQMPYMDTDGPRFTSPRYPIPLTNKLRKLRKKK